jgi:phage tail sheath protein FI
VATRTAFVIQDTIDEGLLWAIDKPMTTQLVKDILDTINAKFRAMTAAGHIMGANAWYDPDLNLAADLSAGKLVIDYDFTPCAPLESLGLNSRITDRYYATLGDAL